MRGDRYITRPKLHGSLPKFIRLPSGNEIDTHKALTIVRAVLAQTIPRLKRAHPTAHMTIYALEIAYAYFMKIRVTDDQPIEWTKPKRRKHPKS